jgi:hypothetical protein
MALPRRETADSFEMYFGTTSRALWEVSQDLTEVRY